jgi:hypothetical protein
MIRFRCWRRQGTTAPSTLIRWIFRLRSQEIGNYFQIFVFFAWRASSHQRGQPLLSHFCHGKPPRITGYCALTSACLWRGFGGNRHSTVSASTAKRFVPSRVPVSPPLLNSSPKISQPTHPRHCGNSRHSRVAVLSPKTLHFWQNFKRPVLSVGPRQLCGRSRAR